MPGPHGHGRVAVRGVGIPGVGILWVTPDLDLVGARYPGHSDESGLTVQCSHFQRGLKNPAFVWLERSFVVQQGTHGQEGIRLDWVYVVSDSSFYVV